eukprot:GHVU01147761.1.p1 GENE.GHVU01147761.1~~GHVU01147761.1.p1  ORF type:complete len:271 (+),score=53.90 GHVU01147761.1:176-988(+)
MALNPQSATQTFLDKQYTRNGILRYEFISGKGFISTGGSETTEELLRTIQLCKYSSVLDVGCGIGGSAMALRTKFGCRVTGIDVTSNAIAIAKERLEENGETANGQDQLKFEVMDVFKAPYEENSFDLIYSKDAILYIPNKDTLFRLFHKWLKPGGQILITDYGAPAKEKWDAEFTAYMKDREYDFLPPPEYAEKLRQAGISDATGTDMSTRFRDMMLKELKLIKDRKEEFLKDFTQEDLDALVSGWEKKVERVDKGLQIWTLFKGTKPA